MHDLTPVGLSQDGTRLILISARGVEFAVALDQSLRDALAGDQGRLGQLEMTMESTLRPRDIQARIRAGETTEAVAAAANTTVDRIMTFAGPVLAERAHIAQSAQLASIRRRTSDPHALRTLDAAAPPYFREVGTRPDDVEWDAWRRDDGRWTLVALFTRNGSPARAEFTYDAPGRYVTADNEAARQVTGEAGSTPKQSAATSRRLSAVPQDQLPLGDDLDSHPGRAGEHGDLGDDALSLVRDHDALIADHADADWMAGPDEPTTEIKVDGAAPVPEPTAPEPTDSEAKASESTTPVPDPEPTESESTEPEPTGATDADQTEDTDAEQAEESLKPDTTSEPPATAKSKKRGRASVPSWDEIMFGGGSD